MPLPPSRPPPNYRAARDPAYAFESVDGRRAIDVQLGLQGARDLHAAVVRAAQALARTPRLRELVLAARLPRLSRDRVRREWGDVRSLLRPHIAERLALLVLGVGPPWSIPDDARLMRLGAQLETDGGATAAAVVHRAPPSRKFFDVFSALLDRWLRGQGPIAALELMKRSGSSFPTVAQAIHRMEGRKEVVRRSKRAVELVTFPRRTWEEMLPLAPSFRDTISFVDTTGRAPDPVALLRRLRAAPHVAVGGVIAARHWDPKFDLHGVPRLDLEAHVAPAGMTDLFERLRSGLQIAPSTADNAVVVVHVNARPDPGFEPSPKGLPWAAPVEVLFDLHELRLVEQGGQMVERLRSRRRP